MKSISQILRAEENLLASQGIDPADALLLLEHVSGKSREYLLTHNEETISKADQRNFELSIKKRSDGYSVAHLRGFAWFYGLQLTVTEDTLIPRPETEILVEEAIAIANRFSKKSSILDIGTGSGAIIIALANVLRSGANYTATDISKKTLEVARQNAASHDAAVMFLESDLFEKIPKQPYDIITANLPYLTREQMRESSIAREPKTALYGGGACGTAAYERLFANTADYVSVGSVLLIEIDPAQKNLLLKKAEELLPRHRSRALRDVAGQNRVITFSF